MKQMKFGFFIGSDITAHLIIEDVVRKLLKFGHKVYLFYPCLKYNVKQITALRELFFYERTAWHEYIFPQVVNLKNKDGYKGILTPQELSRDNFMAQICNVNDPIFLNFLKNESIDIGVCVRWYQKFGMELIDYFNEQGPNNFVNLHPGLLPNYRGVFTFSHAMRHKEKVAGFTLHKIDSDWDAGPILSKCSDKLDYRKSVLENMIVQRKLAVKMLIDFLSKSDIVDGVNQADKDIGYYSHLTKDEVLELTNNNIPLSGGNQLLRKLIQDLWQIDPEKIYLPIFNS